MLNIKYCAMLNLVFNAVCVVCCILLNDTTRLYNHVHINLLSVKRVLFCNAKCAAPYNAGCSVL